MSLPFPLSTGRNVDELHTVMRREIQTWVFIEKSFDNAAVRIEGDVGLEAARAVDWFVIAWGRHALALAPFARVVAKPAPLAEGACARVPVPIAHPLLLVLARSRSRRRHPCLLSPCLAALALAPDPAVLVNDSKLSARLQESGSGAQAVKLVNKF